MNLSRKPTMKNLRAGVGLCAVTIAASAFGTACSSEDKTFRESACGTEAARWCAPRTFAGGITADAHTLTAGHDSYMLYCYACHGENGDGRGPSSYGLRPPPRNFTLGIFKFARLRSSDELPHDDDLYRIVHNGLNGTAMLPWDIPDVELMNIIQYIKTFAPAKWEKKKKSGELVKNLEPFELPADPWAGKEKEAEARGKELYHFKAECANCHPAFGSKEELYKLSVEASKREPETFKVITGFREDPYGSVAKDSTEYGVWMPAVEAAGEKVGHGMAQPQETKEKAEEGKKAGEGKAAPPGKEDGTMVPVRIFPPDFTFSPLRSVRAGSEMEDLFRVLSYGVYPIMPAWKGALEDKDIWAIAHYVKSLMAMRDTPEGMKLKARLANQAPFEVPVEKPAEEKPAGEATEGDKKDGEPAAEGDKKDAEKKDAEKKDTEKKDAEKKDDKKGVEKKDDKK